MFFQLGARPHIPIKVTSKQVQTKEVNSNEVGNWSFCGTGLGQYEVIDAFLESSISSISP